MGTVADVVDGCLHEFSHNKLLCSNNDLVYINHTETVLGGDELRRNMRAERARLGLSAEKVAQRIGVHVNSVRSWERGDIDPNGHNLVALAALYDCSPEYLLGLTDERKGHADFASAK